MRQLRLIFTIAILAVAFLPVVAAENPAKIFVYLPWDSLQHSRLTVSVDGAPAAMVRPGRFFLFNADSGRHLLMAGDGIPIAVEARSSKDVFLRIAREVEIGPSGKSEIPVLEVLSPEQARPEIVNLVYVAPKEIFSPLVNKEDPFLHERPKLKTRSGNQ